MVSIAPDIGRIVAPAPIYAPVPTHLEDLESGTKIYPYRASVLLCSIGVLCSCVVIYVFGDVALHGDRGVLLYGFIKEDAAFNRRYAWFICFLALAMAVMYVYQSLRTNYVQPSVLALSSTTINLPQSIWRSDTVAIDFQWITELKIYRRKKCCWTEPSFYEIHFTEPRGALAGKPQRADLCPGWLARDVLATVLSAIRTRGGFERVTRPALP